MSLRISKNTWKIKKTHEIKVNSIRRERGLKFLFLKNHISKGKLQGERVDVRRWEDKWD